jgi:hypothetical protein
MHFGSGFEWWLPEPVNEWIQSWKMEDEAKVPQSMLAVSVKTRMGKKQGQKRRLRGKNPTPRKRPRQTVYLSFLRCAASGLEGSVMRSDASGETEAKAEALHGFIYA